MDPTLKNILALDIGNRRIGVAVANLQARLSRGVETIDRNRTDPIERIGHLVAEHDVGTIVAGLPRDMRGNETDQTRIVQAFADELRTVLKLPVEYVDEAATSLAAVEELEAAGKPYEKGEIDMRAAVIILDDWLAEYARRTV